MQRKQAMVDFASAGFIPGRMISGSKSAYVTANPDHVVLFNGNLISKEFGKLWWGDLDLTLDAEAIQRLANALGSDVYALPEFAARFENESNPQYDQAVAVYRHG